MTVVVIQSRLVKIAAGISLSILAGQTWAQSFTVSPATQNRSGLLRLRGVGFGASAGQVRIAGIPSPVARWLDDLLECYVPESAPLGSAMVTLSPAQGSVRRTALMKVRHSLVVPRVADRLRHGHRLLPTYGVQP